MSARRPGCSLRELDLGGSNEFGFEMLCRGKRIGAIMAVRRQIAGKVRYVVRGVNVIEPHRRKGIATELYERAAVEACRRRAPLASDERVRDAGSIQFWHKQIAKGRADVLSKRGGWEAGQPAPIYSLRCPAPPSLRGRR